MKTHVFICKLLPVAIAMAVSGAAIAQDVPGPVSSRTVSGEITPTLTYFDYFSGSGADRAQFVERYFVQRGFSGDRREDGWLDANFVLKVADADRDLLTIERRAFGRDQHRNKITANTAALGIIGYLQQYRSATGGLDYLFSPGLVAGGTDPSYFFPAQTNANSGYVAQFNDDSQNTNFTMRRTNYGLGVKLKPAALADRASFSVAYDGYEREGRQFNRYVLGGGDIRQAGTNASVPQRVLQRWRGFDQEVDETNRRVTIGAMGIPGAGLQVAYQFRWDKYDNNTPSPIHSDVVQYLPPGFQYNTGGDATRPLGFHPDSNLITNSLRLTKTFPSVAFGAGYANSRLEQDSFTQPQQRLGFDVGKIRNNNAYFTFTTRPLGGIAFDGYYKYFERDNDSSFPVPGLFAVGSESLDVRINRIETNSFGVNGNFRIRPLNSNFTLGWKHEDTDRNLTFNPVTLGPPVVNGISPDRSLYQEQSRFDELSLRMSSRIGSNTTLRIVPSYRWAGRTALVTEPENQFKVKSTLTHMTGGGSLMSAYYTYVDAENNDLGLTGTDGVRVNQDTDRTNQSAGLSFAMTPSEWVSTQLSFAWLKDDYDALFFGSNRRRYEAPGSNIVFFLRDQSNYAVDTYVLSATGDWQASDALTYSASYSFSASVGHTATGFIRDQLPLIDGRIDNRVHSLALGVNYRLNEQIRLSGGYVFDYYDDDAFSALTGGVHSLSVGVGVRF